jgi:hypothetical protein
VGVRHVDQDVAIYWVAAKELAHLRLHEPFFYGQAYHHLAESALAAPFVALGVPVWVAPTAISMAIGLLPWALLSLLAWRRGIAWLAILLLGVPVLMPAGYQLLLTRFFGTGLLLVTLALVVSERSSAPARWDGVGALLTLGVAATPNAALLACTVVAGLALSSLRTVQDWLRVLAGAAAGLGVYGLGKLFYLTHPGWVLHPAPPLDLRLSLVAYGLHHLPALLRRVTPEVMVHPAVPLAGVVLLVVLAIARRRWAVAVTGTGLIAGLLAILASGKIYDGTPSPFFACERFFLGLPLAIAWLGVLAAPGASTRPALVRAGALLTVAGVLLLAGWKQLRLSGELERESALPQNVLRSESAGAARVRCRGLEEAARAARTDLVLFAVSPTRAYACDALSDGRLTTLHPPYERRTWLLLEEARRTRDRLLLTDVSPDEACARVQARVPGATCTPAASETVLVQLPPESSLAFASAYGLAVRPF